MKLLIFILFTSLLNAQDTVHCDDILNKPKSVSSPYPPASGHYVKSAPYYVAAASADPVSEELIFFFIAQKYKKHINTSSYMSFHRSFSRKIKAISKAPNAPLVIDTKITDPVILSSLNGVGFKITKQELTNLKKEFLPRIKKVKEVLALKSNQSYRIIKPENASVKIVDDEGSIPVIQIKSCHSQLNMMVAASKLTYFKSKEEEQQVNLNLVKEIRSDLAFISKSLPSKGTSIKEYIDSWLKKTK